MGIWGCFGWASSTPSSHSWAAATAGAAGPPSMTQSGEEAAGSRVDAPPQHLPAGFNRGAGKSLSFLINEFAWFSLYSFLWVTSNYRK